MVDVQYDVRKGMAPLSVQFWVIKTGAFVGAAKTYFWFFGDGRTSTEARPRHVYQMPGIYNGYVRVVDEYGNEYEDDFTIRAYDQDLTDSDGGVHVTYTDKCYRSAILARQGVGIVEWGGDNWVWPEAYVGAQKAMGRNGEPVSLVLNRRNGRFYRVGIRGLWQDRVSTYGGHEIPSRLRIKEHLALAGEQNMIEHRESHITIRPYTEEYRGQDNYTADGLRSAQEIRVNIYRDGEQKTPYTKVQKAPIYGDYIYGRRAKAKRLQAEIELTASAYRITKIRQLHQNCDERVGPAYAVSSESNWQREFATPDLWLCRNRLAPLRDRARGIAVIGTYAATVTGPDGVAQSAVALDGTGLYTTLPLISSGTIGLWLSLMGAAGPIWVFPQFSVSIVAAGQNYSLRLTSAVWTQDVVLNWNAIDWVFVAISLNLQYITIYVNGQSVAVLQTPAWIASFGGLVQICPIVVTMFDVRRVPRVVSAGALGYYYDNVTTEGGNFLPMQR